jgi:hypothetical protein
VKFADAESAQSVMVGLQGRVFAGRAVRVAYLSVADFLDRRTV